MKVYNRKYYRNNKDQRLAYSKEYYWENREMYKEKRKSYRTKWRQENPEAARAEYERYAERRLARQVLKAGRPKPEMCEIPGCGGRDRVVFDHCHQTGKFRGWICNNCNLTLGAMDDNPNLLRELATYLERGK